MSNKITARSTNYSQWYLDIVLQAKLADYSPVKGCMVIRPRGYAIWERIQALFDARFKETGHQNAYFPLLIPTSFLQKEAEHIEGFAPELAVVTHGGGEELQQPLCIRPTSETIIWAMYKNWIQSWRDLPLLYNQWCPIVRWEKRPRLFLRTIEFLWQEGHTAHETESEAREETMRMLNVYQEITQEQLCLPVISGRKSESEKFAGAIETYSIEAMMQDKKALQAGTSHFLGQNFARAFDVQFQTREGSLDFVWASSWGVSTRLIGAIIMTHSDDKGLVLPPSLAPEELVIIPIFKKETKSAILAQCDTLLEKLKASGIRAVLDSDDTASPGWKFAEWELRGVPLRLELGPRDLESGKAVLVRRDTGEKQTFPLEGIAQSARTLLHNMQKEIYEKALLFRTSHTMQVRTRSELIEFFGTATPDTEEGEESDNVPNLSGGFAEGSWCGSPTCEASLKEKHKITIRCLPLDKQIEIKTSCCLCNSPGKYTAIFARNY